MCLITFLLWVAETQNTFAQPQESVQLKQVVVTGTRNERSFIESPVRTEVITAKDIQQSHARNAKEALHLLPGALIQKIHGKTGYEVWLQGVNSDRILILIDGEPVASSTGTSVDLTQISTINIKRIEVVKGATSALYGSNAIGGVINIITNSSTSPYLLQLRMDGGNYGQQNLSNDEYDIAHRSVAARAAINRTHWYGEANIDVVDSDGFNPYKSDWDQYGPQGFKGNATVKLGLRPSDKQHYFLSANQYQENTEYHYTENRGGKPIHRSKREEADRQSMHAGADWITGSAGKLSLRLYHETFDDVTQQDSFSTDYIDQQRNAQITTRKVSSQWDLPVFNSHLIILGAEYQDDSLQQSNWTQTETDRTSTDELADEAERDNQVFYIQDSFFLTPQLELLPGFRYQVDSDFGSYLAPKINGRYDLPSLWEEQAQQFLRFGVGRGYRVPSLKERYYIFDHSQHGYMVFGNPDLQPESSNSYQLGWVLTQPEHYYLEINLFRNDLTDLIETGAPESINTGQGFVSHYRYVNLGSARTQGVEFSSTFTPIQAIKWSFSYTWLQAEDLITHYELPKRPKHLVKSTLDYQLPNQNLTFSLIAHWQSEAWYDLENQHLTDEWSRFDFKTNYQLNPTLKLFAGIDNITNTQRDFQNEFDLRPDEGRFVYLGFNVEID